jgi:hypothetical protein
MRRRFPLCLILIAALLATGSPSDLMQTFAWGRMFAGYVRTRPVAAALRLTFAPDNLCCVCRAVQAAQRRQDASAPAETKSDGKILLVCEAPPRVIVAAPAALPWTPANVTGRSAERAAPPTPPPLG